MARKVLMAEVSGGRVRGRPRLGWMDGVKFTLGNRGITVEAACPMHVKSERVESPGTYVTMTFTLPFLLGTVFFRTALPCSGGDHLER